MKFTSVCLISRDVQRLSEFYGQTLQVNMQGDATFAWTEIDGLALSIYHEPGMYQMAPDTFRGAVEDRSTLEFRVGDVDAEYDRLLALGAEIVKPPTTQPWGIRSVWFRDPDGNIVNFCAPVEPPKPSQPAEVVASFFQRLLNEKDLAACDDLLAEDYLDHDALPGSPTGPGPIREYVANMLQEKPDLRVVIEETVAQDLRVALRMAWRWTDQGRGEARQRRGMVFIRLNEAGKLAERWSVYEPEALAEH